MNLLFRREDGSFVIEHNGLPYHVVEGDEPLWSEAVELAAERGADLPFERPAPAPVPSALTRLSKAEIWRRCSDQEAEAMDAALSAAPLRLRRIFQAATYLDTTDEDYPMLRAGIVAAVGESRAVEILAPDH